MPYFVVYLVVNVSIYGDSSAFLNAQYSSHVVDGYLSTVGGRDKWSNIETIQIEKEVKYYDRESSTLPSLSYKTNYVKIFQKKQCYYSETVNIITGKGRLIYNGNRLTEISPHGSKFVSESESQIVLEHKRRTFHYGEPWMLIHSENIEYGGEEIINNFSCHALNVTYKGLERKYFIRKDNHLLVMVSMFGGITKTYYEDYRDVQGYLLPFSVKGYVSGNLELETKVERVIFNGNIPDSIFTIDE